MKKYLSFLLCFLLVVTCMVVMPAAAEPEETDIFAERIADGGFESASDGAQLISGVWDKRGTATAEVTSADAHSGTMSALLKPGGSTTAGGTEGLLAKSAITVTEEDFGDYFLVEAYMKAASATPAEGLRGRVGVRVSSSNLKQSAGFNLSNEEWTRVYYILQANESEYSGGYKPMFGIYQNSKDADATFKGETAEIYVDDLSMRRVKAADVATPSGAQSIPLPEDESVTETYTTEVLNEFGDNQVSQNRVVWSLQEEAAGVSIDPATGVLTVTKDAAPGTVNIIATQDGVASEPLSVSLTGNIFANILTADGTFESLEAGANLFSNGWQARGSKPAGPTAVVTDADGYNDSAKAALLTPGGATNSGGAEGIIEENALPITLEDNLDEFYIIEAYMKAASATPADSLRGKVALRCNNGSTLLQSSQVQLSNTEWARVYYIFQINEKDFNTGGYKAVFGVHQSGSGTNAGDDCAVYIDNASVSIVKAASLSKPSGKTEIPLPGSDPVEETYKVDVFNEFGDQSVSTKRLVWSLQEEVEGVSINPATGVLTVTSEASIGTVHIVAEEDGIQSEALEVALIDSPPEASEVSITDGGNNLLTGHYTYTDNHEEANSRYRWLRGTDLEDIDNWEVVMSGNCTASALPTYTVTENDYNNYLVFEITPVSTVEPVTGTAVRSEPYLLPVAPVASNVTVEGGGVIGRELTGTYVYSDANETEADQKDESTYRWLYSSTEDGNYQPISGATDKTYTVTADMAGKYIKFEVTPKNSAPAGDKGVPVTSDPVYVTSANQAPVVTDVRITGNLDVSSIITGAYEFSDPDGDDEGQSRYQWYFCDTADGEFEEIPGENARSLVIPELYAGKFIKFEVTPVDKFDLAGTTVQSEAVQIRAALRNSLFVALDGSDENDGSLEEPYATVEKARDTIRDWKANGLIPEGGVTVYIRGGLYHLSQTFELTEEDSGTADMPIVYRPYGDEKVTFSGGYDMKLSQFQPVNGDMKNRLKSVDAQNAVVVANLADLGIDDVEAVSTDKSGNRYNLYAPMMEMDGERMNLARYPNSDLRTDRPNVKVTRTSAPPIVTYTDEAFSTWTYQPDQIWYLGYWQYEWAAEYVQGTIDSSAKTLTFTTDFNYDSLSANYSAPIRAFNIYEEIDEPGEWYIDRANGKLYIYPVDGSNADSTVTMTHVDFDLFQLNNASNITLQGLEIKGSRGYGVVIDGGTNNKVENCDIHLFENKAVDIKGVNSYNNGVNNSKIYHCGFGAANLNGGDTASLTLSENYITNSEIFDFSMMREVYAPGVGLGGAGNILSHNDIYNCAHQAVSLSGVLNVIEYNKLHNVCRNAADMGAIYLGRRLTDQENTIRYNHFYDVGDFGTKSFYSCCVFTDDGDCNTVVYGNVAGPNVPNSQIFKVHGGANNRFYNNLLLDAPRVFYQSAWDKGRWYDSMFGTRLQTFANSAKIAFANELWLEKWPYLADLKDSTSKNDIPYVDVYPNEMSKNVYIYVDEAPHSTSQYSISGGDVTGVKTNLQFQGEQYKSMVKDWDGGNYTLTDAAYAEIRKSIPEFETIPFEAIGPVSSSNAAPTARNVKIFRDTGKQNTLIGSYTYYDSERDLEGESIYKWYVADQNQESSFKLIDGANERTFTYTDEYADKFIKFEVTPKDSLGNAGTPVRSEATQLISSKDGLLVMIQTAEELLNAAVEGSGLGEYPKDAIEAFKQIIDDAKDVYEDEGSDITAIERQASLLQAGTETFQKARVQSFASDMTSGVVEIPDDLTDMDLNFTNLTGELTLQTDILPAGTIRLVINGKEVTITVPAATPLADGKLTIRAMTESTSEEVGDSYVVFMVGTSSDTFAQPLNVTVSGAAGNRLRMVENGQLVEIAGSTTSGQNLVFPLVKGGEIAVYGSVVLNGDASLNSITVNDQVITCVAGQYDYSVELPYGTKKATVSAATNNANATVKVTQPSKLPGTAKIAVTAQDGTAKATYTVSITIAKRDATPTPSPTPDTPVIIPPSGSGNGGGNGGTYIPGSGSILGSGNSSESNQNETNSIFKDTAGHWAQADIEELFGRGIVAGVTADTFEPERQITRAEFATLVVKALGLSDSTSAGFADVAEGTWYFDSVNTAANAGLIVGSDGYFRPDDVITREEMAVIVAKAYALCGGETGESGAIDRFSDKDQIASWAQASVDIVTGAGLISGMTPSTFSGQNFTTRAQAAAVIRRMLRAVNK